MPTVPRYNPGQVREVGIPSARMTEAPSLESFGAGRSFEGVVGAAQGIGNTLTKIIQTEKMKADDTFAKEAEAELTNRQNFLLHGENGVYSKKGKNALSTPDGKDLLIETSIQFDQHLNEVAKRAKNSTQREMVRQLGDKHRFNLQSKVNEHVAGEIVNYQNATDMALIKAKQESFVLDPSSRDEGMAVIGASVDALSERKGLSPEQADILKRSVISETHKGVVDNYLVMNQPAMAKQYFKNNIDSFTLDDRKKAYDDFNRFQRMSMPNATQDNEDYVAKVRDDLAAAKDEKQINLVLNDLELNKDKISKETAQGFKNKALESKQALASGGSVYPRFKRLADQNFARIYNTKQINAKNKKYQEWMKAFDEAYDTHKAENDGKNPNAKQVQQMIDDHMIKRGFFGDKFNPEYKNPSPVSVPTPGPQVPPEVMESQRRELIRQGNPNPSDRDIYKSLGM